MKLKNKICKQKNQKMPRTFNNSEIFLTQADATFLLLTQTSPLLDNDSETLRKKKNAESAKKSRQKKNDFEKKVTNVFFSNFLNF